MYRVHRMYMVYSCYKVHKWAKYTGSSGSSVVSFDYPTNVTLEGHVAMILYQTYGCPLPGGSTFWVEALYNDSCRTL